MSFVKKLVKFGLSPLAAGIGLIAGGKRERATPRQMASDPARAEVERDDELRRRRGAAADMVTGATGAALPGSGVGRLIAGS